METSGKMPALLLGRSLWRAEHFPKAFGQAHLALAMRARISCFVFCDEGLAELIE